MAAKSSLVNLDAMIRREDFAVIKTGTSTGSDLFQNITVRDFLPGALLTSQLRKPDFQRETNHWTPDQVVSLLECFVNGDLIPSVILWKSPTSIFVIDGGHRLSVIRSWIEDDYGDSQLSSALFSVTKIQKKIADRTRELVKNRVGTWQYYYANRENTNLPLAEKTKISTIFTRAIQIQWVPGDADKAEASFFKINTQGTALDDVEETLLSNRKKPVAISARAIIRSGKGHKYWSKFPADKAALIESVAGQLHTTLFQPDIETPIKTLDLPLGGSSGVRTAIQILIEFTLLAIRNQEGLPKNITEQSDDTDGTGTVNALKSCLDLANRITGNENGSLGLHPAIYFYGPRGHHIPAMFLGTVMLIARKLVNNDKGFFEKFTKVRGKVETALIEHKDLIASIMQKTISQRRVLRYANLLDALVDSFTDGIEVTDAKLVDLAGLTGRIILGSSGNDGPKFSEEAKSGAFISRSLANQLKCPICHGFLDPTKSLSYDHIHEVKDGGKGDESNCQPVHPYCNQAFKNKGLLVASVNPRA